MNTIDKYNKYNKYNKYLKKMNGGGIKNNLEIYEQILSVHENIKNDLQSPNSWCYTGSAAVFLYCIEMNLNSNIEVNDLDILFVPDSCLNTKPRNLGNYFNDKQNMSNNGIPYYDKYGYKTIDLICKNDITYITILFGTEHVNLVDPDFLQNAYKDQKDDLFVKDDSKLKSIEMKLALIDEIKEIVKNDNVKYSKIQYKKTKDAPDYVPERNIEQISALRFDDSDDDM